MVLFLCNLCVVGGILPQFHVGCKLDRFDNLLPFDDVQSDFFLDPVHRRDWFMRYVFWGEAGVATLLGIDVLLKGLLNFDVIPDVHTYLALFLPLVAILMIYTRAERLLKLKRSSLQKLLGLILQRSARCFCWKGWMLISLPTRMWRMEVLHSCWSAKRPLSPVWQILMRSLS